MRTHPRKSPRLSATLLEGFLTDASEGVIEDEQVLQPEPSTT